MKHRVGKADFIAKMSIAHKEALESAYWLRLIQETELISANRISDLSRETDQLIKILSSYSSNGKTWKENRVIFRFSASSHSSLLILHS